MYKLQKQCLKVDRGPPVISHMAGGSTLKKSARLPGLGIIARTSATRDVETW